MPGVSEDYLEKALSEYNDKVNDLESAGDSEELLEAYVNSGCVLKMLEHYTSSLEDLESAAEMADKIGTDDGTYVKMYSALGELYQHFGMDASEPLGKAASRLNKISSSSHHFDSRRVVSMCISSSEVLLEDGFYKEALPCLEKALDSTDSKMDPWMRNRRMEAYDLMGELYDSIEDPAKAIECYDEAIELGTDLMKSGNLEDTEQLAATYMAKAECELDLGMMDHFVADSDSAIFLIEEMHKNGMIDSMQEATDICHNVAAEFMKVGKVNEAEKYLMKAMSLTLEGAKDYIEGQGKRLKE